MDDTCYAFYRPGRPIVRVPLQEREHGQRNVDITNKSGQFSFCAGINGEPSREPTGTGGLRRGKENLRDFIDLTGPDECEVGSRPAFLAYEWKRFCEARDRNDSKWLHDVLLPKELGSSSRILEKLASYAQSFPRELFIYAFHSRECDEVDKQHYHVVHACTNTKRECRCRWRTGIVQFCTILPKLARHKHKWVRDMRLRDFEALVVYLLFHEGRKGTGQIALAGTISTVLVRPACLRYWTERASQQELLGEPSSSNSEVPNERGGFNFRTGAGRVPRIKSLGGGEGGIFAQFVQVCKVIVKKYSPYPLEGICGLITQPSHPDFTYALNDPRHSANVSCALELIKKEMLEWNLKDYKQFYFSGDISNLCFRSSLGCVDIMYFDRARSLEMLDCVLTYQFPEVNDRIGFLKNWCEFIDRKGWYTAIKMNSCVIWGPPNAGKSTFVDCWCEILLNVGLINYLCNRNNQFSLQECVDRRLITGNEISIESNMIDTN